MFEEHLLIKGAKVFAVTVKCTMFILHVLTHIPHITNMKHSCQDTGNGLNTSNNQGIEKCLWCVLWLYNWDLHIFFWRTTYYWHGHKLELLKFTIIIIIFHLVWYWIDTSMRSSPSVSVSPKWQPKLEMTLHLLSIPTGHHKPSRTEKQLKNYCYLTFVILAFLLALDHQMMFFFWLNVK